MSTISTQTFHSENANWLVDRSYAQRIKAASLTNEHVGLGIYHELYRDHQFLFVSSIAAEPDGMVSLEYLQLGEPQKQESNEPGIDPFRTPKIVTETPVLKNVIKFRPDEDVLLSTKAGKRPQGSRVTVLTTREVLDD